MSSRKKRSEVLQELGSFFWRHSGIEVGNGRRGNTLVLFKRLQDVINLIYSVNALVEV